jgi:two-component system chemotaxis response regulator CheY
LAKADIRLKVLVVEDMLTMRNVIVNGIKKTFFNIEVDETDNGFAAQSRLGKIRYDMIISDWEMPKMSGLELLQWVRSTPSIHQTPFIMITGNATKESITEAMRVGVTSYMVKPFTMEGLAVKMSAIIDKFDRRQFERLVTSNPVTIHRKGDKSVSGNLIDISAGGLFGIFPRSASLPFVMDDVSLDIFYKNQEENTAATLSLQGFVIRLQAAEVSRTTDNIKIAVKFDEASANGNSDLLKFLDQLKSKTD